MIDRPTTSIHIFVALLASLMLVLSVGKYGMPLAKLDLAYTTDDADLDQQDSSEGKDSKEKKNESEEEALYVLVFLFRPIFAKCSEFYTNHVYATRTALAGLVTPPPEQLS